MQDLAELAGVHRNTIYDLQNDDEGVTLRTMKRVADALGIAVSDVFGAAAPPDDFVPAEYRPLIEPLRPLTQEARESIIRNIAANLTYMGMVYRRSVVEVQNVSEVTFLGHENGSIPTSITTSNGDRPGHVLAERAPELDALESEDTVHGARPQAAVRPARERRK